MVVLLVLTLGVLAAVGGGVSRQGPKRSPGGRPAGGAEPRPSAVAAPPVPLALNALVSGGRHERSLPPGEPRRYMLSLSTDQYLHLVIEQFGVDIAATVRDPAGRSLLRVDSPNGDRGPEDLFLVSDASGPYLLEVTSPEEAGGTGRYEIRVEALRVASGEDRDRAAAAAAFSRARLIQREGTGNLEEAAAGYEEAARLWRKVGDEGRKAWALYRLGMIYVGDPSRRREGAGILDQAIDLFGKIGEEPLQAIMLSHLGDAWLSLAEFEKAGDSYEEALTYWESQGNLAEQAPRLNDLAVVRRFQGRTHAAIDFYSRAVAAWSRVGAWKNLATTHANFGLLYATLGESRLALDQYHRALLVLEREPEPGTRAVILVKQADVLLEIAGPEQALELYREAFRLQLRHHDTRGKGVALNGIGRARMAENWPGEALQAFRSAAELFQRVGDRAAEAVVMRNLGGAYERLGYPARARELFERALRLSPGEEAALFGLARVARMEGRLDDAESWSVRTLDAIEAVRGQVWRPDLRAAYHASRQEHYAFLIDLLAERHRREPERGHDARAFEISERARARSLLDIPAVANRRPDAEELRRFDELSRQVNAYHRDLLAVPAQAIENDAELADLMENLRQAEAEVRGPIAPGPPIVSLTQAQAGLVDGETLLLEYYLGEERSFLWAVTSAETRFITSLPGRREIEEVSRQAYRLLLESHHQTGEVAARQAMEGLSRMLLGPVADLLDQPRLVIVAPGALQSIPFAALFRPLPGGGITSTPMIAEHEIVSLPSASVLATLRGRRGGRRPPSGLLAVVADPVFGPDDERFQRLHPGRAAGDPEDGRRPGLRRLRYASREAEAILALAEPHPVLAALGFDASRDLVRSGGLSDYRILHFATHGLFNDLYPELSGLALSAMDRSGERSDGQIRAYEIADLDLRADLVVLSACRTGLGKEIGGEGLVGLTQAFLRAGAPRLVVSLWDVDDRATSELMKRFYTALLAEGLPPAQALRQAQLSLWREDPWRAPYYWAGFAFQGEWN